MRQLLYPTPEAYASSSAKSVALFGMSGVGKTRIAGLLSACGDWHHASIDERIGSIYMAPAIDAALTREAMRLPKLAALIERGACRVSSRVTADDLSALSDYLGKPGDPAKGGMAFSAYLERQREHRAAETAALLDTPALAAAAREGGGPRHFLCDTGGSIAEVVDPDDPADPVLGAVSGACLMVQIRGTAEHEDELARRFRAAPKPMYYDEAMLHALWAEYRDARGVAEAEVDPDDFAVWGFRRLVAHRGPRYDAIAAGWGVSVEAAEIASIETPEAFDRVVADAIARACPPA